MLWKILEYYEKKDDEKNSVFGAGPSGAHAHDSLAMYRTQLLDTIVKLTAWNHRWYIDFSPKLNLAAQACGGRRGHVGVEHD